MKRSDIFIFVLLITLVATTQIILGQKHLQFGFFTDDWLFLSAYRAYVINPILDLLHAWKNIGSHNFAHAYYVGILFSIFSLDYLNMNILNQTLKVIATLSLYPLIYTLSKNRKLAFLATVIYGMHYSPFGTLDNASRGEDFIGIILMNLFLSGYFKVIINNLTNFVKILVYAVWLFTTILVDVTRLFPVIFLVFLMEIVSIIWYREKSKTKGSLIRLSVIFFPFLPLLIFSPDSILFQVRYAFGLIDKIASHNWQLFLTPLSTLGSTYVPKNLWTLFGNATYETITSYIAFILSGPIFIFFLIGFITSFFVSKKPMRILRLNLFFNFIVWIIVFFVVNNWLFLDPLKRAPVDPGTYLVSALVGIFFLIYALSIFLEWKKTKSNKLTPFIFIGVIFGFLFTFSTWLFADLNSIFIGVHPYLNIPSIGSSLTIAVILLLMFEKLKLIKIFGKKNFISAFLIIGILLIYFNISKLNVDLYFSTWLDNGLRASDQERLINQFWAEVGSRNFTISNLPLIYLDAREDKINGTFYSEAIIWKVASWLDLRYTKNQEDRFSLCQVMVLGEAFDKYVSISKDGKTIQSKSCGENISYSRSNFFSFKLKDRNLIPNTTEIFNELVIK